MAVASSSPWASVLLLGLVFVHNWLYGRVCDNMTKSKTKRKMPIGDNMNRGCEEGVSSKVEQTSIEVLPVGLQV